jgi:hypothetical protein
MRLVRVEHGVLLGAKLGETREAIVRALGLDFAQFTRGGAPRAERVRRVPDRGRGRSRAAPRAADRDRGQGVRPASVRISDVLRNPDESRAKRERPQGGTSLAYAPRVECRRPYRARDPCAGVLDPGVGVARAGGRAGGVQRDDPGAHRAHLRGLPGLLASERSGRSQTCPPQR